MSMREAGEHLVHHRPDDAPREMGGVHPLVDAPPGQYVHDEKRAAVGELSKIARSDDGGMVEQRDGARFLVKPPAFFGTGFPFFGRAKTL